MKTATLTLDGKTYKVQLTDEQVTEIEKPKRVTGFERVEEGESCFSIDATGTIYSRNVYFENLYSNANYYSDESLAEWCNRNDTLNRKMRRWAAEHNEEPIDWTNEFPYKYHLYYDFDSETVEAYQSGTYCRTACCYFNTLPIAKAAIEEFGEEIKWLAENRPKWF